MPKHNSGSADLANRKVRVFISSTFRDTQDERAHLLSQVFPDLQHRCRERRVTFEYVDLRWGVTKEESERGESLMRCLQAVDESNYFIGILGERYGWAPAEIAPELLTKYPWLSKQKGKSITELEILHGALNNHRQATRVFFYFRDPAFITLVPMAKRPDFTAENRKEKEMQAALKERIRESKLPLRENFGTPEELGRMILDDLWVAIVQDFPAVSGLQEPFNQDESDHSALADALSSVFVGREEYLERLTDHVNGIDPPLVVTGEPGVGKSALLAKWVGRYRRENPHIPVLVHFVSGSAQAADHVALMYRVSEELKRRLGIPDDIPENPEPLIKEVPLWLAEASDRGRMVLVLDGLDQLEDRDDALALRWLPASFPENIRVVLSTIPGPVFDILSERGWPTLTVKSCESAEREELIREYLSNYEKRLTPEQTARIVGAPQCENTLFLKTVLEAFRFCGSREEVDQRIKYYLAAQGPRDLFEKVIRRWEEDYEKEGPEWNQDPMSLPCGAKQGLSEDELLSLLGYEKIALPREVWLPLCRAADKCLIDHSSLLTLSHGSFREAVQHRYLLEPASSRRSRFNLVNYFNRKPVRERMLDELPWQLAQAKRWADLKNFITRPEIFVKLNTKTRRNELAAYWKMLGDRFDMEECYREMLRKYERAGPTEADRASMLTGVGNFLRNQMRYSEAEWLYQRALAIREKVLGPEHPSTANSLDSLADIRELKGDYPGAEPLCRRALAILEKVLGPEHPDTVASLSSLGILLSRQGDYAGAEPLFRRALAMREKVFGPEHPDTASSLDNLVVLLLWGQGDYAGAEPLCRRALAIREKVFGPEHPDTAGALHNLASLLSDQGDYAGAEPLCRRALAVLEKVLGPEHPKTADSLNNLANVLSDQGDYAGAESLYRRGLAIVEKAVGPEHHRTALSLGNLATLMWNQGDYAGAESLYRRTLTILEKVLGPEHPDTATCLINLAMLLKAQGDYESAEPLCRRALAIEEKVLGPEHPETAHSLNDLASLLKEQGDCSGAEPLYRRALAIQEKVLGPDHYRTQNSREELADLLQAKG